MADEPTSFDYTRTASDIPNIYPEHSKRNPFKTFNKEYKSDLQNRWMSATADPTSLGMSDAEIEQAGASAATQAAAVQNAGVMQMNQAALGANPFKAGAMAEAARGLATEGEEAAASTVSQLRSQNSQLINDRMESLRNEMIGQRQFNDERGKMYLEGILASLETGGEIAKQIIQAVKGGG